MNAFAIDLLERFAWNIPFYILLSVGIRISLKNRTKSQGMTKPFLWAFSLFFLVSIASCLNKAWFTTYPPQAGNQNFMFRISAYGLASGVSGILDLVGWALLILGVHRVVANHAIDPGV